MRLSLIVAVARNGVIGKGGNLAWKISDDLKFFRETTTGHPVIMGRKTFDSIGKPLPKRTNIVISRTMKERDGVHVARTIESALEFARCEAKKMGVDEAFVIGGADLYEKTLPLADRLYLTEVEADVDGDVRFPAIDPSEWSRRSAGRAEKSDRNDHACAFFVLDRL